jgi:hypothetical protein
MTRQGRRASTHEPLPLEQIPVWRAQPNEDPQPAGAGDGVDSLIEGLNPEQRRAVCHGDGPLLVVAGAGTGKTQVITRRIAWLIATRRARPSEILALTFTDKAADEMQVRVDQLVPYGYTDAAISTFHAFGDRLVREFALELGLPTDLRVLSRPEVVIFLRERLFEFELEEYRPTLRPSCRRSVPNARLVPELALGSMPTTLPHSRRMLAARLSSLEHTSSIRSCCVRPA